LNDGVEALGHHFRVLRRGHWACGAALLKDVAATLAGQKRPKNVVVRLSTNLRHADRRNLDTRLRRTRLTRSVLTETLDGLVVTINVADDAVVLRLLLTRKVTGLGSGVVKKALGLLPRTVAQLNLTVDVVLHVSPPKGLEGFFLLRVVSGSGPRG
jgi:hypothetical protein